MPCLMLPPTLSSVQLSPLYPLTPLPPTPRAELRERVKSALLAKAQGEGLKKAEYNFDSYMLTGEGAFRVLGPVSLGAHQLWDVF